MLEYYSKALSRGVVLRVSGTRRARTVVDKDFVWFVTAELQSFVDQGNVLHFSVRLDSK